MSGAAKPAKKPWTAALLVLGVACTPVPPTVGELEAASERTARGATFKQIPDQPAMAPAPEPKSAPEVEPDPKPAPAVEPGPALVPEPAPHRTSRRVKISVTEGEHGCWGLKAVGMPAIDDEGVVVTAASFHMIEGPTPGDFRVELRKQDELVEAFPIAVSTDSMDASTCARDRRTVGRGARAANKALASHRWRPMLELPVEYADDDTYRRALDETSAVDRPVQLIQKGDNLVARVVGVNVLERHAIPRRRTIDAHWSVRKFRGTVDSVYADRETGTVLVIYRGCAGSSCTCDPAYTSVVLHWSEATFDRLDSHPCRGGEPRARTCLTDAEVEEEMKRVGKCDARAVFSVGEHSPFGL